MSTLPFSYPSQAVLLPVASLNFGERTRQVYPNLEELASSISSLGLIHPPCVNLDNQLIAGGRRCRAMIDVLKVTHIPVVYLETLDEAHLRMLEDQENYQRSTPPWQDRVLGIHRVHNAKVIDERVEHRRKWTVAMTGELFNLSQAAATYSLSLVPYILAKDQEICSASTPAEAWRILVARREKETMASLAMRNLPTITTAPVPAQATPSQSPSTIDDDFGTDMFGFGEMASRELTGSLAKPVEDLSSLITSNVPEIREIAKVTAVSSAPVKVEVDKIDFSKLVIQGDSIEWMKNHPDCCDHIVTDIPYGIEMSNLQQQNTGMDVSATAKEHDVDYNLDLFQKMFPAMFTALKSSGFAVLFCDMQHWWNLAELAQKAGFAVQRWPLVWNKAYPCINQAATYNFTKSYEVALVLRKGNATLVKKQPVSVFTCDNPDKEKLGHPFAKPLLLWKFIYEAIAIQNQIVLDPFAGSGSASVAALNFGLIPIAVELNPEHCNRIVNNLKSALS